MLDKLRALWAYAPERCGLVLDSGEIIELVNHHPTPWDGFQINEADIIPYRGRTVASWHTHPKTSANLSVPDYHLFRQLPSWFHYIIGRDEVRCYYVRNGVVFQYEGEV